MFNWKWMPTKMDENIKSILTKIGNHLADLERCPFYSSAILEGWEKLSWINFIVANYRFDKDEMWFLEIVINKLIKLYKNDAYMLDVRRAISEISCNENLTEQFIKKYRNVLDWDSIARNCKPSFRLLWLMRRKVEPDIAFSLDYNKNLSLNYKRKFLKLLNWERRQQWMKKIY